MQTTRRRFLGAAAAAPWIAGRSSAATRRPNIFIVIGDDLSAIDIGCYGSKQVSTPHIDRLASEGIRFTRAFTATAMCAPMRQQMYTGIFPVRNGAYPNHSKIKPGIRTWPSYFKEIGYRVGLVGKRHFGPPESYPFEFMPPDKGDELNFGAIEEFVNRGGNQPYCLLVTSHQPHGPHNKGDASRHPPSSIAVPSYWVDTPLTRENLSKYYAEVEYLDGEVGRCLRIIERAGQTSSTIFAFCSEQGIGMPFAKWTCYDLGLREAVVLRWPGKVKPGSTTNAMVQGVDWLPTLLEAAGGNAPPGLDGRSFLRLLEGKTDRHNEVVYGVHTTRGIIGGSACYPIRSIRTGTHKLILNLNHQSKFLCAVMSPGKENYWNSWVEKAKRDAGARRIVERYMHRPPVELYDLTSDPFEQNNLAARAESKPLVEKLTARLQNWMKQQGDLGVETEMLVKPNPRAAEV